MELLVVGNRVKIVIDANELINKRARMHITLPDGYSYETIHITYLDNISEIIPDLYVNPNTVYHIPPVKSHSPCTLELLVEDVTRRAEIKFLIEKFRIIIMTCKKFLLI